MHDIGFLCTSIMSFKIDQKVTIDNQIQRVRKRGGGGERVARQCDLIRQKRKGWPTSIGDLTKFCKKGKLGKSV